MEQYIDERHGIFNSQGVDKVAQDLEGDIEMCNILYSLVLRETITYLYIQTLGHPRRAIYKQNWAVSEFDHEVFHYTVTASKIGMET